MIKTEIGPAHQGHIPKMRSLRTGEYGIILEGMHQGTIVTKTVGDSYVYVAINNYGIIWDNDCTLNVRKLQNCSITLHVEEAE